MEPKNQNDDGKGKFFVRGLDHVNDPKSRSLGKEWEDTEIEFDYFQEDTTPDKVSTFGQFITIKAAKKMIRDNRLDLLKEQYEKLTNLLKEAGISEDDQNYLFSPDVLLKDKITKFKDEDISEEAIKDIQSLSDDIISVTFSKQSLLFLLSLPESAGIKFYFCKNHENVESLVLTAVDSNNCDLGDFHKKCFEDEKHGDDDKDSKKKQGNAFLIEVGGPHTFADFVGKKEKKGGDDSSKDPKESGDSSDEGDQDSPNKKDSGAGIKFYGTTYYELVKSYFIGKVKGQK